MISCPALSIAFLVIITIIPWVSSLPYSLIINDEAEDGLLSLEQEQREEEGALIYDYEYDNNVPITLGGMVEASFEWPLSGNDHEQQNHQRNLQLTDDCVEDGPYFYGIDINISPGNTTPDHDQCLRPDQILLGHDLNLLLIRIGLGERNDDNNILAMGGVCPRPGSGVSTRRRRMLRGEDDASQLHRELGFGFVYRGGFACGWFCTRDNRDARRKLMFHDCDDPDNWLDCYISQVKRTVEATVRSEIAPKYLACLGTDPNIDVTMSRSSFDAVNQIACGDQEGDVKEFLESFTLGDFYIDTNSRVTCKTCNSLDFAKTGDGVSIDQAYINTDTWQASHGVQVSAYAAYDGGYTPGNKTRAFNANKQTSFMRDLRTPNEQCPGGGPGLGSGGVPGQDGENCVALGNVLVINRSDSDEPEPNPEGGIVTFQFDNPVLFSDLGIIDADGLEHRIRFQYSDGTSSIFTYYGFGDNSVQRVLCNQYHVIQVDVIFRETAGITEINFCEHCTTLDTVRESMSTLIAMEDFEGENPLRNWYNGRVEHGGSLLTTFLGRFGRRSDDAHKTYMVPADATSLTISLDFFQIDTWDFKEDTATIYVGSEEVPLGNLRTRAVAGNAFSGSTPNGVTFLAKKIKEGEFAYGDFGGGRNSDNIWRVELEVPGGDESLYGSGKLMLKFHADLNAGKSNESFGIDNIKIVANNVCQSTRQLYFEDFENFQQAALKGWTNGSQDWARGMYVLGLKYLGRYYSDTASPIKKWTVPSDADMITFSVDLYQFDFSDNTAADFNIAVGTELINLGDLRFSSAGEETGGRTTFGVTWQAQLAYAGHLGLTTNEKDHLIHINVQIPRESGLYDTDGRLKFTLSGDIDQGSGDENWGWDNLEISSIEFCNSVSGTIT